LGIDAPSRVWRRYPFPFDPLQRWDALGNQHGHAGARRAVDDHSERTELPAQSGAPRVPTNPRTATGTVCAPSIRSPVSTLPSPPSRAVQNSNRARSPGTTTLRFVPPLTWFGPEQPLHVGRDTKPRDTKPLGQRDQRSD